MANTREIRRRIKSIKNTAQITKAMQMVAASKMRKAQTQALSGRPYAKLLDEIAAHMAGATADFTHPLLEVRPIKKRAVLVITSDKGLCGSLNVNLLREVHSSHQPENVYVTVGRKGRQFLARMNRTLLADFELKDNFRFKECKSVSQYLLDLYEKGEIDAVDVYYSRFESTLVQKPTKVSLMPIGHAELALTKAGESRAGDHLFEPDAGTLLSKLLPYYVHLEVYQYVLDARASEHSARMVAMKSATDNANEMIRDLTLEYNKVRQAAITNELLEITTAQMALN